MSKRDYYEVLGVPKGSEKKQIKQSYRKLAIKYHPDRNEGDKDAEDKFKEAAEAYEVLSNDEKRKRYDQFGHQGTGSNRGGFGGNMNMEDIFDQFGDVFGGFGGSGFRSSEKRVIKGSDLRVRIKLNLKEISEGTLKKIKIKKLFPVEGIDYQTCNTCNGSGAVTKIANTILGQMQTTSTCHNCQGSGKEIIHNNPKADAQGMIHKEELTEINIPAGVSEGMQLKVRGQGNHAPFDGVPGDLLVLIEEEKHSDLTREGNNIYYELFISIPDAILGSKKDIPTLSGKVTISIPEGIQNGKILRLKSKGIKDIESHQKGDLLIHINIWTPEKLTQNQIDFFTKNKDAKEFTPDPKNPKSFFEKIREAFN
jgi:molecular chaperone DnaJ